MKNTIILGEIFEGQEERIFAKKSVLFETGQKIDGLYLIRSGHVKVTAQNDDGQRITFNSLGPGDLFPLPLYFGLEAPALSYRADGAVKASWRPREQIDEYLHTNPKMLYKIISKVLSVLYGRINILSGGSADERVIKLLIELSNRWGTPGEDKFEITTTQQQLADSVSLSRESVNMVLNRLADKGVVTMGRNKVYMSIARAKAELGRRSPERLHQLGAAAAFTGYLDLMG